MAGLLLAGGENFVALDLIVQHVHSQLEKVSVYGAFGEGRNSSTDIGCSTA